MCPFELVSHGRVPCPYCLHEVVPQATTTECSQCEREVPRAYITQQGQLRPLALQVLGWQQHGKTAYLNALLLMLTKISRLWPRYLYSAVSEETQRQLQEIHSRFGSGELPLPSPGDLDQCHILQLRNMERWGHRTLLLRDSHGEHVDTMNLSVQHFPFLLRAPISLMVISLFDLAASEGRTMDMLMNNYLNTLTAQGIEVRSTRRKLIVVLTKADLLQDLPAALRSYLSSDGLWAAVAGGTNGGGLEGTALDAYLRRMKEVDEELRYWLDGTASGQMFLRLAEEHSVDLRFCLVSATGSPVGPDGSLQLEWQPRRVLDPCFWAFEMSRTLGDQVAASLSSDAAPERPPQRRFRMGS